MCYCLINKKRESPVGNQHSTETAINSTSNGALRSIPHNVRACAYERVCLGFNCRGRCLWWLCLNGLKNTDRTDNKRTSSRGRGDFISYRKGNWRLALSGISAAQGFWGGLWETVAPLLEVCRNCREPRLPVSAFLTLLIHMWAWVCVWLWMSDCGWVTVDEFVCVCVCAPFWQWVE